MGRTPRQVLVFGNGMVMAFDKHGQQMPEYQGKVITVIDRLREVYAGPWIAVAWPRDWPMGYRSYRADLRPFG